MNQTLDLQALVHAAGDAIIVAGTDVLRVPALDKDGRPLSIGFTVALICAPDGEVQTIASIVRDETVRWQEERALRSV